MTRLARLEAWLLRRAAPLGHPRAPARAAVIVPLLCGLLSLAMGQDDGWDMRNYHLYNVYALLNGRLGVDLSPAGFQTYFNPMLDVPYYLVTHWFPAPVAGFVFGALHGLAFVLVAAIARVLVGEGRLAMLLAVAGIMSAAFLSELGNSMGDNLTALLVLASVYSLLRHWERLAQRDASGLLLSAGAVMGLGLGLKLTNVSYAMGACVALLTVAATPWVRVRTAFVYGVGVLAGMAATAGYWMFHMWSRFGNPLFPQFNNLFHSPMASELGVLDEGHLPRNAKEALLWPFVFSGNMSRIAEVPIQQIIWPLLYSAVIAWALGAVLRRVRGGGHPGLAPRGVFLLVFAAVAYVVWVRLFSIYRYLAPLELLAPLLFWLLVHTLACADYARRLAGWLLLAASVAVLPFTTWGHAGWAEQAFSADTPAIEQPQHAVIFQASQDSPMGWLAQFMPREAAVVGLGSGFPESPAYVQHRQDIIAQRGGPHYIMFPLATDQRATGMQRKTAIARTLGLTDSEAGCRKLEWLTAHVRMKAQVERGAAGGCTLALQPQYRKDTASEDRAMEVEAARRLRYVGLAYDPASCANYHAAVGTQPYPYRMCKAGPLP
ncbi:hypothetical protein GCM10027277_42270 [Pseudoduganella ginsengisoli]|uniref:DUF2029 domain-containing protein n=1 Tax=Pseudoduganella ginsengisoli TaxID=1462440 RepID=A0A6L6Q880_9BURK|nr:glycosyltransferase 87 family protein [Pseudoduganella ginsengisoli]MTW05795.1 hypothetical protein [Pseudoduganella ginsengisoli]